MPELRPRWWQWPTVLSLDATVVALVWQALIGKQAGIALGAPPRIVLGASVWLAYAADRWIEGWRLRPEQVQTPRHAFYQRARWPMAALGIAVFVADVTVAGRGLLSRQFWAGACLLPAVLLYLLSHQLVHRHHPARVPKEICVALLLAFGVGVFIVPLLPAHSAGRLMWPIAAFTVLAFSNCALISAWEHGIDRAHGQTSLSHQFSDGRTLARAATVASVILGVGIAGAVPRFRALGNAAALAGVLLLVIDLFEPRLGRRAARVLADAALLTPLLWLV